MLKVISIVGNVTVLSSYIINIISSDQNRIQDVQQNRNKRGKRA